ncbi:hypothetical protein GGH94_002463 [Coemansia aciculifera]|uniref:CST complex subunit CTC1 n=1 Tax=Coemansia aciculifera TaxID=417176 RepID=A0A9W8IJA8_9FUNG|nr:hypothetical protein GGH94_002463 [Coemansia aciculifera]
MDPSTLVRVCSLASVRRAMQSTQSGTGAPGSRWFGSSGGCALLGKFRVAERVESYDYAPFHIPAGCMVFSDYDTQLPREEIRCQALSPLSTWFGGDTLVLLTGWRYVSQPESQHSQSAAACAFIELLSAPVLLPATTALSDIERPLSWWLKHQVYPELELEDRFFSDMRQAPPLDSKTAATILAQQHRRGSRFRAEVMPQVSSVLGRVSAVGSLMPTKKIDEDDGFGFLIDISIDPASADGKQALSVPVLLYGRRFLGLFASLGIGDSLFVSGLLLMPLHIEGADSVSVFVTSSESSAYRIDDFDGLDDASVRLPVASQQPYTQASQGSLFSRIAPSVAATDASGTPYNTFSNSQHFDSWQLSQVSHGGKLQSQPSLSQASVQKVESSDGHLLVHHNRVESYSGLVTRVIDATLGIYLVDDCHILMLTFWPLRSLLSVLRPGTRVLLDNMHVLLLANSKGYHWSWFKRIWPQSVEQPTPIDEQRALAFGACARSSVRIVAFADTIDPGPANSVIASNLAAYVARRAGGLVRMIEAIESFWRLQVKFPSGLSADSASSPIEARDSNNTIMDLALRLVGHPQSSSTGKPSSYRRLYLEFLDHGRCTSVDCMRGQPVPRVVSLGDVIQRFLSWKKENWNPVVSSTIQHSSELASGTSITEEVRVTNTYPIELKFGAFPLIGRLVLRQRGALCLQDATGWLQIRPTAVSAESDDPEMLGLEFSGQALVGHIYSWSHWRLATEAVNIAPVVSGFGAAAASALAPFELFYVAAALPTILHTDHSFGCGDEAGKRTEASVAQSFLLIVHTQSPVVIAPWSKKSKTSIDSDSSSSSSGSSSNGGVRARTSWTAVKGTGLRIGYPEFHMLKESGSKGAESDTLRVNVGETTELLTCVVSYDPDQLAVSLIPGCAYIVCVADPSMITYYNPSSKDIHIELRRYCHVHPAWITATDCSGAGGKAYVAKQHHELLARASSGDQSLHIPTIQIETASSNLLDLIRPPPIYPVRELHSLLARRQQTDQQKDGNSRPGDIVSVHGTITKRGIKKAVAFASNSSDNLRLGSKRSKVHGGSAGLLAGRFDTRIVLRDDRDSESTVTLYIELSSFAHPLGLVPGTRVVVRDARLDMAKGSGRAYLSGVAATSFQAISAKQAPDLLVQVPNQATGDAEPERVSIGQLYGRRISKVTFRCSVSAIEQLHISVSCRDCKQAVCEMLCACAGRHHKIAAKSATILASIELLCRVADGSGVARLVVSDETTLGDMLGLSTTETTKLFSLAARSNDGQLVWMPQQEERDTEADKTISHAAATLPTVTLRVEGAVRREHLSHSNEQWQPLRLGGQSVIVRQQPLPKVSAFHITRLTTPELCLELLADLGQQI